MKIKQSLLLLSFLFLMPAPTAIAAQVLFTPAIVISQQYTDNIYLSYQNTEDDYITTAGIDLTGQMIWRTAGFLLNYNPTYNRYWENDNLNNWRHSANIDIWKDFTRNTKFSLRDSYLQSNDPADTSSPTELDNQFIDANRQGRDEYLTNTAETRLSHNFGSDDSFSIAVFYSAFREIDPPSLTTTNDNNIITPAFILLYNIGPRWGIDFNTSYAISDYFEQEDRRQLNGSLKLSYLITRSLSSFINYQHTILTYEQNADSDYQILNPTAGFRYTFQDNAHIELGLGYYSQQYNDTSKNTDGYNVSADISKRWTIRRAYFGITGNSGYQIDDDETRDNGFNIYYQGRVDAGYNFTPKLTGSVYFNYRYDDYPDDPTGKFGESTTSGAALSWQALQWVNLRLTYDYRTYNTNTWIDEYKENRVQLTIRIAPPNPYKLN